MLLVIRRLAGVLAALAIASGAAMIVVALEGRGFAGYVSEAGVSAEPRAGVYRIGVFATAAALALLAAAVTGESRIASGLLVVAAAATSVSASVPCSAGCPLPPYERASTADLVHAAASIAGVGVFALALAALAFWAGDGVLRGLALVGAAVIIPLGLAIAAFMLAVGRGTATATMERTILTTAVLATLAIALRLASSGHRPPVPAG